MKRLRSWGVNSLGAWSDDSIDASGMPYTLELEFGGNEHGPWGDVFSPDYAAVFDKLGQTEVAPHANDPHLIGYFTDNELGWWDDTLFTTYVTAKPPNATHTVLIDLLRKHYAGDFTLFQHDFDPGSATGFDDLQRGGISIYLRPHSQGRKAIDEFTFALATEYYKLAHDTIRKYDKNHLILGDRYCQFYAPQVARAAAPYVDVISTNYGSDWTDGRNARFYFDALHRLAGKPVIVTEFYFCANENRSGNKNSKGGFPTVQTQVERAAGFRTDLKSLASIPYLVGAHWFQYNDEPQDGRGDGENYDMGLVDIHNQPYDGMIHALQSLDLPAIHANTAAISASNGSALDVPPAPHTPMAGLADWDKERGYVPSASSPNPPFSDLYATWSAGHLYLSIIWMDYRDNSLYAGGIIPREEKAEWKIQIGGAAPIDIWANTGRGGDPGESSLPTSSDQRVTVMEIAGLKSTVIADISASAIGKTALHQGEILPITAELINHGRLVSMQWHRDLRLTNGRALTRP